MGKLIGRLLVGGREADEDGDSSGGKSARGAHGSAQRGVRRARACGCASELRSVVCVRALYGHLYVHAELSCLSDALWIMQ